MDKIFAIFVITSIGKCLTIIKEDTEERARQRVQQWLSGDDIAEANITKVEEIDLTHWPATFWDHEISGEE